MEPTEEDDPQLIGPAGTVHCPLADWARFDVTRTDPPRLTHSGSNGCNDAEIVVVPRLHAAALVTCNAGDRAAAKELLEELVAGLR